MNWLRPWRSRQERRLWLAYEQDWLTWAGTAEYGDTFPTFEDWKTGRTEA